MCDASALEKTFNVTKCMVPEHFEKTIFLSAMYTFTVITILLCVAEIFEILCRRLGYLNNQWRIHTSTRKRWLRVKIYDTFCQFLLGSWLAAAGLLSNRKLTWEQNLTCGPSWVSCTKRFENVRRHSWQVWNILWEFFALNHRVHP